MWIDHWLSFRTQLQSSRYRCSTMTAETGWFVRICIGGNLWILGFVPPLCGQENSRNIRVFLNEFCRFYRFYIIGRKNSENLVSDNRLCLCINPRHQMNVQYFGPKLQNKTWIQKIFYQILKAKCVLKLSEIVLFTVFLWIHFDSTKQYIVSMSNPV